MTSRRVVLGLGSNLGDRGALIQEGVARLARSLTIEATSFLYESPPAGGPPQGDYFNAAVLASTDLTPREILTLGLSIERELGRDRSREERWGPRTLDIDVLWIEGERVDEPDYHVPHPRLHERPFALIPLLDVAPDACDPTSNMPLSSLAAAKAYLKKLEV
jgi:2-amino-4-hydroxy-6-hydroxymethyldihydropteridine diphosphokinase